MDDITSWAEYIRSMKPREMPETDTDKINRLAKLEELISIFRDAYPEDLFSPITDEERDSHDSLISRSGAAMGRHMIKVFDEAIVNEQEKED